MDLLVTMQSFRRVVELGGFSAAARDQGLSNAVVSKHVSALEAHLKTRLLQRTTRRVSPTTEGAAYYQRCIDILAAVEEAEQAMSRPSELPAGLLRVNAPMSFGLLHLAPLVPRMLREWPELRVHLSYTDRMVDLVEEGVDVVVRVSAELPDSATLVARRLARARHLLCASPDYLDQHGTPTSAAELRDHDCITYSRMPWPHTWSFSGPDGPVQVAVTGRLSADNSIAIREAVLAGLGIALMPAFYVQADLRAGRLRSVLDEYTRPLLHVHAVYQKSRYVPPKVRAFVDFLRERFTEAEWAVVDGGRAPPGG